MQIDVGDMAAEVYAKNEKGVYYVKVSFPTIGMFINSITVQPSPKFPEKGLWVQMPRIYIGRWKHVIEFRNDSPLRDLIHDAALLAVDQYQRDEDVVADLDVDEIFDKQKPP